MVSLRPASFALALAAALASASAGAEELRFGVRSEVSWDDNLFSTPDALDQERIDDWSLRITPSMEVEDRDGSLQWEFRYSPAWEGFLDTEGADGWDHQVGGSISYRITPDTSVEVSDDFARFQSISRFNETLDDDLGQTITETVARRTRLKRNDFQARLTHQLSRDQQLAFVVQHFLIDLEGEGNDRSTLGTVLSYRRVLTERLTTGVTGGWRRQTFESEAGADDRETDFFNVSGVVEYRFDPTLDLSATVGPSWVEADATEGFPAVFPDQSRFPLLPTPSGPRAVMPASCPTTDAGTPFFSAQCDTLSFGVFPVSTDLPFTAQGASDSSGRLTYFADVSLSKRWERWTLVLSYRRQDDTSGSLGTSTISDTLNATLVWRPSPRWNLRLGGAWIRREQSVEAVQPVILLRPTSGFQLIPVQGGFAPVPAGTGEAVGVGTIEADNDFEQTNIVISGNVSYRLTRRVRLFARAYYTDVSRDGLPGIGDFDRFTAGVGINYEFEPIRF